MIDMNSELKNQNLIKSTYCCYYNDLINVKSTKTLKTTIRQLN